MILFANFSSFKHLTKQDQFSFAQILHLSIFGGERKFPELFQTQTFSLLTENCPIFKNYKAASFSKNGWELKFQPILDYHDKKIQKQW